MSTLSSLLFYKTPCCRKAEDQQQEEGGKPNEDGPGRDNDSLYGATVFSFSDIKHMYSCPHLSL